MNTIDTMWLPVPVAKALLAVAGDDVYRPAWTVQAPGVVMATDGHILGAVWPTYQKWAGADCMIDRKAIADALRGAKARDVLVIKRTVAVVPDPDRPGATLRRDSLTLSVGAREVLTEPLPGRAVNWRRVVDSAIRHQADAATGEQPRINPELLVRLANLGAAVHAGREKADPDDWVNFSQASGPVDSACLMRWDGIPAVGAVMPLSQKMPFPDRDAAASNAAALMARKSNGG